jgi:hypothetical protein
MSKYPFTSKSRKNFYSAINNAGAICMRHLLPVYLRTVLFWAVTHRVEAIFYRRFGTTYRSHLAAY